MKSVIIFLIAMTFCVAVSGQTNLNPYNKHQNPESFNPTKAYLGFSTGINN